MLSTAMCVSLLTTLVSCSQVNFMTSGILNVTAENTRNFSACHRCLVLSIGIKRIDLIEVSKDYRLYWIDGRHSSIIKKVISHCSYEREFIISAPSPGGYVLNDPARSDSRMKISENIPNKLENSRNQLAKRIVFAETEVNADGWTANLLHKKKSKTLSKRIKFWKFHSFLEETQDLPYYHIKLLLSQI